MLGNAQSRDSEYVLHAFDRCDKRALFSVERLKRITLSDWLATAMQAALETTYHKYTPLYNIDDCYNWIRAFEATYHSRHP